MGVGLPSNQGVSPGDHRRGNVGVQIKGAHDQRLRPHKIAHRRDQVALRIVNPFGYGCTVQEQQHPFYRHGFRQSPEQLST